MENAINEQFKKIENLFFELLEENQNARYNDSTMLGTEWRKSEKTLKNAEHLYELLCDIDKSLLDDNQRQRINEYSVYVLKHMGIYWLRKGSTDSYAIDKNEINKSISYLQKALELSENDANTMIIKPLLDNLRQIIRLLSEAYSAIGDDDSYLMTLERGVEYDDLPSICFLIDYYCSLDLFDYKKIMSCYERFKSIAKKVLEDQKAELHPNSKEDFSNIIDNFHAYEVTRDMYVLKELLVPNCLKQIGQALLDNSYFDDALEVGNSLKNDYKEFIFWDDRYEIETAELLKKWQQHVRIKKEVDILAPNESILRPYFKAETISQMSTDIKIFIATSLTTYDKLKEETRFTPDYSPAILPLCKAIESILYLLTIEGFLPYIIENQKSYESKAGIIASHCIYNEKYNLFHLPDDFGIGKGLSILCHQNKKPDSDRKKTNPQEPNLNTGVADYFKKNGIQDIRRIINLYKNIDKCRIYRNATAHKERVSRIMATEARDLILETTKIIERAFEDFGELLCRLNKKAK